MSILMDGVNSVNSLTAQINKIKSNELGDETLMDPSLIQYTLEKNFNQMLEDLLSSSREDEDEEKNNDPFSFLINSNQTYVKGLVSEGTSDDATLNFVSGLSDSSYLDSLYAFKDNALALQSYLNLQTNLTLNL